MIRNALFATIAVAFAVPLAAAPTTVAKDFVKQAGASDLYEKTSSQMMLTAKDAKVRDFAKMMVSDHNKSTAEVKAAAKSDGIVPTPPKLMPAQQKMIADLKAAKPADRERLYVSQQVTAHEQALALHQMYAKSGATPALKQAAAGIVPVVQTHLTEVKGMQGTSM